MIASVRGTVQAMSLTGAVVEVGGVGLAVSATPETLAGLHPGQETLLHTHLVIREDAWTLFGFARAAERDAFVTCQSVSGVGPRLALAMLAVHSPESLRRAVEAEDLAALVRVPGIGRKGAARIALELKGKLAPDPESGPLDAAPPAPSAGDTEVLDALVNLGWPTRSAAAALETVRARGQEDGDVAVTLRLALRELGRTSRG